MVPSEVVEIIRKVKTSKQSTLNLLGKELHEIPTEVFELSWLKTLLLGHNKISIIPPEIVKLRNLVALNLTNNKIKAIPKELQKLQKLETLDLSNNKIDYAPPFLFSLGKIEEVLVRDHGWADKKLYLTNNPIENPPLEILDQGMKAVKNYFDELDDAVTEKLYEAKLIIVGEPGAGKTTLAKKLFNIHYQLDKDERSTEGIEISSLRFEMEDQNTFQINIWDFGGQEIYHATHQFFLTKRSLYVLLDDTRAEDTDFNYWMQITELLSDNSPVLIVQNEKQDRKRGINELGLRGRFKNLLKVMITNLKTNRGLEDLVREVKYQIRQLDHVGTELPKAWLDIRKEIEHLTQDHNYIDLKTYFEICSGFGLNSKERAIFLSDYLHDLGVFLHFSDHPILKRIIVLRTEWGTDAVYKVLDNKKIRAQYGLISREDLKSVWGEEKYIDMQDELLALMQKFELCYQIESSNSFIAPQLLPASPPTFNWSETDPLENLEVRYEYEFMPKGILTRFIVRRHHLIKDQKYVWKEGVILEKDGAIAEVVETYGKKDIRIRINGMNRSELMTIILDEIDRIHRHYHNLSVAKVIPCKCPDCQVSEKPFYFKYDLLKKYLAKGKKTITCGETVEEVRIGPLIKEINFKGDYIQVSAPLKDQVGENKLKVFLSYARKDHELKEKLDTHLSSLRNLGMIDTWNDQEIHAGEDWKQLIEDNLETADVILLLITANFLNSDFCFSHEMERAINLHDVGSCIVIPVIVKPTALWKKAPFGHLQVVPRNGEAVTSHHWPNIDEAFEHIVSEIYATIEKNIICNNKFFE